MEKTAGTSFPHLFSPWRVGRLEIPNRIVLSPMTTGFGYEEGAPGPQVAEYFAARTRDVGMAVVAFGAVAPEGRVERQIPWMWRDDAPSTLAPVAAAIADNGAVPCLQLGHGGRQASPLLIGTDPVAPSAVAPRAHVHEPPRALSVAEIQALVSAFASAAVKAGEAGFAAVEIHAAHGYLIQQFLAASSNERTDAYGGATVAERARFGAEIVSAVRAAAPHLAVLVRINGADLVPDGSTPDDAREAATSFVAAGAQAVVVSAGVYGSVPYTIPLLDDPEGVFLDLASHVRAGLGVPVVAVGRITRPATAEGAIAGGGCDAVAVGRALLADPGWATKARSGRVEDIRPCIATVEGCAGMLQHGDPISCSVNPDVGREGMPPIANASMPRHILVIGAGPAGLEAARTAAAAGHRVTVLERADRAGGAMALAAETPPLRHLSALVSWYERELARLGVDLRLATEADPGTIAAAAADHVVVATGAVTDLPMLDGYDALPVWTLESMLGGEPSTLDTTELPRRAAVIGGGRRSLATALWLADRGCEAVVVSPERVGQDTSGLARRAYLARIERSGAMVDAATPRRVTSAGLECERDGAGALIECDGVVIADPVRPDRPPWLERLAVPTTAVGDCRDPRSIATAIAEGRSVLLSLPESVNGAG